MTEVDARNEPGLEAPMIDPVQIIAALLSGGLARSSSGVVQESQPAMSGVDQMIARLQANQPKIAEKMQQEKLAQMLPKFVQGIESRAYPVGEIDPLNTALSAREAYPWRNYKKWMDEHILPDLANRPVAMRNALYSMNVKYNPNIIESPQWHAALHRIFHSLRN